MAGSKSLEILALCRENILCVGWWPLWAKHVIQFSLCALFCMACGLVVRVLRVGHWLHI